MCPGSEDPLITLEERLAFQDEMRAAGVDWQVHVYGGVEHSFTHPQSDLADLPGITYDRAADDRSWQTMLRFLEEAFA